MSVGDLDELAESLDKSLSFSNTFDLHQTGVVDQTKVLSEVSNFIVDQLTKSYECFKKSKTAARSNVYIASLIAHEYGQAKKFDLALKFYDRILRGYRNGRDREGWWHVIISGILERVIQCAIHLGMHERILEASFEMIGLASAKQVWMDTFLRSLKNLGNFGAMTFSPSEDLLNSDSNNYSSADHRAAASSPIPPVVVDMTSMGIETLYNLSGAFATDEATVNSIIPFQLVIYSKAPEPFYPTSIVVEFSNSDCNRTLHSFSAPGTLEEIKSHGRTASTSNIKAPFVTRYSQDDEESLQQLHSSTHNISRPLDSKLLVIYPGGPNVIEFPVFVGNDSGLLVAANVSFVFGAFGGGPSSSIGRSFQFNNRFPVTVEEETAINRKVGDVGWFNENNNCRSRLNRPLTNSIQ